MTSARIFVAVERGESVGSVLITARVSLNVTSGVDILWRRRLLIWARLAGGCCWGGPLLDRHDCNG